MARSIFSIPREGFYIDPLFKILYETLFNPLLLISVVLLAKATFVTQIQVLWNPWHEGTAPNSTKIWNILVLLGIWLRISEYLDRHYLNGFSTDTTWEWSNERVLITGGSSGIGASIVKHLLERNIETEIIVVDHRPLQFEPPAGAKVHFYQCDLSDSTLLTSLCERIRTERGSPSVLINNAGLTRGRTVLEGTYQDVEITFKTNIIAPFLLTKEFLPFMVKHNHGHVLATASMSAIISPGGLADYAATKAGIIALQETLRQELRFIHGAPNMRCSTAILGFVQTPMFKGSTGSPHFLSPLIHVDTVGEAIVDTLYSGESRNIWLPGISRYLACLRAGPDWLIEMVRNGTRKLQVDYAGYQRIDPGTGKLKV